MSPVTRTALIIGASRGLGLALARAYAERGWQVIGTVRGQAHGGLDALSKRPDLEHRVRIEPLDINAPDQLKTLAQRLRGTSLDLCLVNAGVRTNDTEISATDISNEAYLRLALTNTLSPMRVVEALHALVKPAGILALMSSGLASLDANISPGLWALYRSSKSALNSLMLSFAARRGEHGPGLLLLAPGWVRTDMGGANADLSIDESIAGVVAAIEARRGQPGLHFVDYRNHVLPW